MASFTEHETKFLIHHLFLPPQLPTEDDQTYDLDRVLLQLVCDTLAKFEDEILSTEKVEISAEKVPSMQQAFKSVNFLILSQTAGGTTDEEAVHQMLVDIVRAAPGEVFPIYIRAQNAGVILTKAEEGAVTIEALELSPSNREVMSTKGRLRRRFPGPALEVRSESLAADADLRKTLAQALSKMSAQKAAGMTPVIQKSSNRLGEIRDTVHPGVVTELLFAFLHPIASPADVQRIWKNTRDDVVYEQALLPWRRSPLWLLVRVALQLLFTRSRQKAGGMSPHDSCCYKLFMLFLLATVLEMALELEHSLEPDLLFCMSAKIEQRMTKLRLSGKEAGVGFVQSVLSRAKARLEDQWRAAQQHEKLASPNLEALSQLRFGEDVALSLPDLDAYLADIEAQTEGVRASAALSFEDQFQRLGDGKLPTHIHIGSAEYATYNLYEFELCAAANAAWFSSHRDSGSMCAELYSIIQKYHEAAEHRYTRNPEAQSSRLLTLLELWIASDQSATEHMPLLRDYDPGVPLAALQWLVLPTKKDMARLRRAEKYLAARRDRATHGRNGSILHEFGTASSFAVRFFNASKHHKTLKRDIEAAAREERRKRCELLGRKKREYHDLMSRRDRISCTYVEWWSDGIAYTDHSSSCLKCKLSNSAEKISIDLHEWPLPACDDKAKAVVFELAAPAVFSAWRDATVYLLLDVFRSDYSTGQQSNNKCSLTTYDALRDRFEGSKTARIGLGSTTKPHVVTHRCSTSGPITAVLEKDICVNNGLRFQYYDERSKCYTSAVDHKDAVLDHCTYKLPPASTTLQCFLKRRFDDGVADATANTVVASQSACPFHLSLAEFRSLAVLLVGYRLVWMNVLLQLASPTVDLKKVEASLIVLQGIYQAGPIETGTATDKEDDNVGRAAHHILTDVAFTTALFTATEQTIARIEKNWESCLSLGTLARIVSRVLSLAEADETARRALDILARLRHTAFSWLADLRAKLGASTDSEQRRDAMRQAVDVALICTSTYDVEEERHLRGILARDEDAATLIRCAMLIHDKDIAQDESGHASGDLHRVNRWRWHRLARRAYPLLRQRIVSSSVPAGLTGTTCLDTAIAAAWPDYHPGAAWETVSEQHDYWVTTESRGGGTPVLHYNLLTGLLLVDGLPLSRLPADYEADAVYQELFRGVVFDIFPSSLPGMQFTATDRYENHTLHFSFARDRHHLQVLAEASDHTAFHFVPRRYFQRRLPTTFLEDYVHWYDGTQKEVVFRPRSQPWTSTPSATWHLTCRGSRWTLAKQEGATLVSPASATGKALARLLQPLQTADGIDLVVSADGQTLQAAIPQLRHEFWLRQGTSRVHARQYTGFEVDGCQTIGTLIGLDNRLVLKNPASDDRRVLVPEGRVSHERAGQHVAVTINTSRAQQSSSSSSSSAPAAHIYRINTVLGRLTGNGSLQSDLFLAYLHGLTSFCLPDPLTHQTGTEQALTILTSAAVGSHAQLTTHDHARLVDLLRLTPPREYYPPELQVMQTVHWDARLPVLSQHPHYYEAVTALFRRHELDRLYYPDSFQKPPDLGKLYPRPFLLQRAACRLAVFHRPGFRAEDASSAQDAIYQGRDARPPSTGATNARVAAEMLFRRSQLVADGTLAARDVATRLWDVLAQAQAVVDGPENTEASLDMLLYDSECLVATSHAALWARLWCWLHAQSGRTAMAQHRSRLRLWLATVAYAQDADVHVVRALAAVLTLPAVARIAPPAVRRFHIEEGDAVYNNTLRKIMEPYLRSFDACPECYSRAYADEEFFKGINRRRREFETNRNAATERLVDGLRRQWPCPAPTEPADASINTHIDVTGAVAAVQAQFRRWYDNWLLRRYLKQVEESVNRQPVARAGPGLPLLDIPDRPDSPPPRKTHVSIADLFASAPTASVPDGPATLAATDILCFPPAAERPPPPSTQTHQLQELVDDLGRQANTEFERAYAQELRTSLDELQARAPAAGRPRTDAQAMRQRLATHLQQTTDHVDRLFAAIAEAVYAAVRARVGPVAADHARRLHHGPRLSHAFLLQQLSGRGRAPSLSLSPAWHAWLVALGVAITQMQRARRLVRCAGAPHDLARELGHAGHTNWDPREQPDSLLMEIEGDFLIRPTQEDIAAAMRGPPGMRNTVMQLNMGEGKSSVIVPAVAAALAADRTRLVRVIVARPQSQQMYHMLAARLGGLVGCRIAHLPFSRALSLASNDAAAIHAEMLRCRDEGGVLLVQPEHLLSLQLMAVESAISSQAGLGAQLLQTHRLFAAAGRDLVDESDENFSVRFELIYTMGRQQPVEFAPFRWTVVQDVLGLVQRHAAAVRAAQPQAVEIGHTGAGRFPRLRLRQPDAGEALVRAVAADLCANGLPGFAILPRRPPAERDAVFRYLVEPQPAPDVVAAVEQNRLLWGDDDHDGGGGSDGDTTTRSYLLHLRGLFAGGILWFVLGQKRWRVHYGLDSTRQPPTRLAVPFRAKDKPAPRSEFSHPDVVLALTCLCYYYQGLDDADLFVALAGLVESDQADAEYQAWVAEAGDGLPEAYRTIRGVNLKDKAACVTHIFPAFRFAKRVIDYFLNTTVFPKQMREFPQKLSASGWDIGAAKAHPTTGFSGTIDSRRVLPLDVSYLDLPDQKHTNALVLNHLLGPENDVLYLPTEWTGPGRPGPASGSSPVAAQRASSEASPSVAETLLRVVVDQADPRLRVILDVGAQILEWTNDQVAANWLARERERSEQSEQSERSRRCGGGGGGPTGADHASPVEAAVFVDDTDELMVLDHRGRTESLRTSPYADQLEACVVFLDEAHTRGIDLRLPDDYRAAVTLGANLTKDRLVQACMRMRKLGMGQSVLFCMPEEIQIRIAKQRRDAQLSRLSPPSQPASPPAQSLDTGGITVSDVLRWAISETHHDLAKSMPLWAVQGQRFERQRPLWARALVQAGHPTTTTGTPPVGMRADEAAAFLEDEVQTMQTMYRPREETVQTMQTMYRPREETVQTMQTMYPRGETVQTMQTMYPRGETVQTMQTMYPREETVQTMQTTYPREETVQDLADGPGGPDGLDGSDDPDARLQRIQQRCRAIGGGIDYAVAALHEEQERELSPEIERERQVERPPPAKPAKHRLHPDLAASVAAGRRIPLLATSTACMPAFAALRTTSAARSLDVAQFPPDLWVTFDFATTVEVPAGSPDSSPYQSDCYQRPPQWILALHHRQPHKPCEPSQTGPAWWDQMIIISPFEAHALLPQIRASRGAATLHLYAPRPHPAIPALDRLDLYTVSCAVPSPPPPPHDQALGRLSLDTVALPPPPPPRLITLLNLFAGQLVFASRDEYVRVCRLLRLSSAPPAADTELAADGFIVSAARADTDDAARVRASTFAHSPTSFLQTFLVKVRRDCQAIDKTHLGRVLAGELLRPEEFQESGE